MRQVGHRPVRLTGPKRLQRRTARGHAHRARADVFAAGNVIGRVTDHDDLRAVELALEVFAALGSGGGGDEVAIFAVFREAAQRKPIPQPVGTELAPGALADVAGQQAKRRRVRQRRPLVEHPHHAGKRPALARVEVAVHQSQVVAEKRLAVFRRAVDTAVPAHLAEERVVGAPGELDFLGGDGDAERCLERLAERFHPGTAGAHQCAVDVEQHEPHRASGGVDRLGLDGWMGSAQSVSHDLNRYDPVFAVWIGLPGSPTPKSGGGQNLMHQPKSQPVTTRDVWKTWYPLALSWLMMGIELPLLSAVVARLANPEVNLGAYGGVVFPLALLIEAPIIMLLTASTKLSRDLVSYKKLWRFMMIAGGCLSALHLLVAVTPLFDLLVGGLLGVEAEILEASRLGMIIMTPWTWAIAHRRFNQGVLIRFGHARAVTSAACRRGSR